MDEMTDDQLWAEAIGEDASVRTAALNELALRAINARELDQALSITAAEIDAARASEDEHLMAEAIGLHGSVLWDIGRHLEAAADLLDSAKLFVSAGNRADAGLTHLRIAMCMWEADMPEAIMPNARIALDYYSSEPFYNVLPHALLELADRLSSAGRFDEGLELIRASQELCVTNDAPHGIMHARIHEAHLLHTSGQSEMAQQLLLAWRDEAIEAGDASLTCQLTMSAGEVLNDTEQYLQAHELVLGTIEQHGDGAGPLLLSGLISIDALALWGLEEHNAAFQRLDEASAILMHWGEAIPDGEGRLVSYDFVRGQWLMDAERWAEAELHWRRMLRSCAEAVQSVISNFLACALLQLERPADAVVVLEASASADQLAIQLDGDQGLWHDYLYVRALSEVGRWEESATHAAAALEYVDDDADGRYVGELWEARALAIVDRDAEAAADMFCKAFDAYHRAEYEQGEQDANDYLHSANALIASQWDRRTHAEGGAQ